MHFFKVDEIQFVKFLLSITWGVIMPISFSLFQYEKKLGRAYEKVNKTFAMGGASCNSADGDKLD